MKQNIPTTNDIYAILQKMFNNQNLDNLPYEETIITFQNELSNYLLDKLLFFKLDHINYTIDNDINLILDTIDELIIDNKDKYNFFYYINDCIIKFITILTNVEIKWLISDEINLLNSPVIIQNSDELCTIVTYDKDNPIDVTKYFVDLIDSLIPTIKQKENALAPLWRQ